ECIAVDLDDETYIPPQEINFVSSQPRVDLRGRQAGLANQREETLLGLGTRDGRGGVGDRQLHQRSSAFATWRSTKCLASCVTSHEAPHQSLVERPFEVASRKVSRDVNDRTSRRSDRDVVPAANVASTED